MKRIRNWLADICWRIADACLGWEIKLRGGWDAMMARGTVIDIHEQCQPRAEVLRWSPADGLFLSAPSSTTNGATSTTWIYP